MNEKNTNRTIEYYNKYADRYSDVTRNADMSDIYKRFEEHLKPGSRILDLGCGSGRDSKYFLDKGYDVVSLDASEAMCRKTQELTGKEAVHKRIENMNLFRQIRGGNRSVSCSKQEKDQTFTAAADHGTGQKDSGRGVCRRCYRCI